MKTTMLSTATYTLASATSFCLTSPPLQQRSSTRCDIEPTMYIGEEDRLLRCTRRLFFSYRSQTFLAELRVSVVLVRFAVVNKATTFRYIDMVLSRHHRSSSATCKGFCNIWTRSVNHGALGSAITASIIWNPLMPRASCTPNTGTLGPTPPLTCGPRRETARRTYFHHRGTKSKYVLATCST